MEKPPFPSDKAQKKSNEGTSKDADNRARGKPQLTLHSFQGASFSQKMSEKKIQGAKLETAEKKAVTRPEKIHYPVGKALSFTEHKQKAAQQKADEARQADKERYTRRADPFSADPVAQNEIYKKLKKILIRGAGVLILATLLGKVLLDMASS